LRWVDNKASVAQGRKPCAAHESHRSALFSSFRFSKFHFFSFAVVVAAVAAVVIVVVGGKK